MRVMSLGIWRRLRRSYLTLSPVAPGWLPARYWRRLWLTAAFRILVAFPLIVVLSVPYWLCQGFVVIVNYLGGSIDRLNVWAANADRASSGWSPPLPPREPVRLNPAWRSGGSE